MKLERNQVLFTLDGERKRTLVNKFLVRNITDPSTLYSPYYKKRQQKDLKKGSCIIILYSQTFIQVWIGSLYCRTLNYWQSFCNSLTEYLSLIDWLIIDSLIINWLIIDWLIIDSLVIDSQIIDTLIIDSLIIDSLIIDSQIHSSLIHSNWSLLQLKFKHALNTSILSTYDTMKIISNNHLS